VSKRVSCQTLIFKKIKIGFEAKFWNLVALEKRSQEAELLVFSVPSEGLQRVPVQHYKKIIYKIRGHMGGGGADLIHGITHTIQRQR
jgi:hypothetical protein